MSYLPILLLISAASCIGATVISVMIARRSSREARSTIFPVVREEETTRARWASVLSLLFTGLALLCFGGWILNLVSPISTANLAFLENAQLPSGDTVALREVAVEQVTAPQPAADEGQAAAEVAPADSTIEQQPTEQTETNIVVSTIEPILPSPTKRLPSPISTSQPTLEPNNSATAVQILLPTVTPSPVPPTTKATATRQATPSPTSKVTATRQAPPSPTSKATTTRQVPPSPTSKVTATQQATPSQANSTNQSQTDLKKLLKTAPLEEIPISTGETVTRTISQTNNISLTVTPVATLIAAPLDNKLLEFELPTTQVLVEQKAAPAANLNGARIESVIFKPDLTGETRESQQTFSASVQRIYAVYQARQISQGTKFTIIWYLNKKEIWRDDSNWSWGTNAESYTFISNSGKGVYDLEIYLNDSLASTASFTIQ